jgi:hypothetical protein
MSTRTSSTAPTSTARPTWREREAQKDRQQREAAARAVDEAQRARISKTETNFPTTLGPATHMILHPVRESSFAALATKHHENDEALYRRARSARERKIIHDTVLFLRSGGRPTQEEEEFEDRMDDGRSEVASVVAPRLSDLYPPHGRRGTFTEPDSEGFRLVTRTARKKARTLTEAELARKYRAEFFGEEDEDEEDVNGDLTDRNQRRDFY